ncbi:GIY-YIG nuclease family protein [Candidatus Berkelbacteria bacterium]|nr:GIY-YIG nuclease family protein [Candidatus Berkelbacteria bacterium]
MYYVYILQLKNSHHYVGSTPDLHRRIEEHRKGYVISTKNYLPVTLLWFAAFQNRLVALRFEKYLKSGSGTAFRHKRLEE